jgi:hypothetical protein
MKKYLFLLLTSFALFSCSKEILQQKLTVSVLPVNSGTVSPPSNSYEKGQTIQLLATPAGEYVFKEWKGDLTGNINPSSLTMNIDKTVSGNFEKRQYPLNLTIEGSGTIKEEIIAVATQAQYPSGTTVRLTPQPLEGWAFSEWSGDLTSTSNPFDLKIEKAISLKATFSKLNFTSIRVENPIDSIAISNNYKFQIKGIYKLGGSKDISNEVKIKSSSNALKVLPNNNLLAISYGLSTLQISYNDLVIEQKVFIKNLEEVPVDVRLKSSGDGQVRVPVVLINYLPTIDGILLDKNRTLQPMVAWDEAHKYPLERAKNKILTDKIIEKNEIEEGTKYHDYSKNLIKPYVNIDVIKIFNVYDLKYVKNGTILQDTTTNDNDDGINNPVLLDWYNIDFFDLFSRLKIKNLVENYGVKEVWLSTFTKDGALLAYNVAESNMSPGLINSTGLDVSNSDRRIDDLPRYNNTYVVYGCNAYRGVDTDLHNRGHQLEAQLTHLDNKEIGSNKILWTNGFVPRDSSGTYVKRYRLGNTHWCPNSTSAYDYWNTNPVLSDIETWKPSGGKFVNVNVDTWLNKKYGFESNIKMISPNAFSSGEIDYSKDAQSKWFIYWWQSIPGFNNNLKDGNQAFTNWWDIFYNWDQNLQKGTRLIK